MAYSETYKGSKFLTKLQQLVIVDKVEICYIPHDWNSEPRAQGDTMWWN